MINIFLGHFWIFELIHIVTELGHLNPINILNALIILKQVEGCWNNYNSAHKYFQDFWKCSGIFNKAKTIAENRKQKTIER